MNAKSEKLCPSINEDQRKALIGFLIANPIKNLEELKEHLKENLDCTYEDDQLISLLNILGFIYARPPEGGDFIWLKK